MLLKTRKTPSTQINHLFLSSYLITCIFISYSFNPLLFILCTFCNLFLCLEMGQQTLIYSFVARGTMILAEYTEFSGNFSTIASQCLQKLPSSNNRFTYNCDGHTFNYLVDNGFSELWMLLWNLHNLFYHNLYNFVMIDDYILWSFFL